MEEEWRDIAGYEGLYQVSSLGRVKSLEREYHCGWFNKQKRKQLEVILVMYPNRDGYLRCRLCLNGSSKEVYVHRLVAKAFVKNKFNKKEVNHIDGVKSNNSVENLEWATRSENIKHAFSTGLKKNSSAMKSVICNETGEKFESIAEASVKTGVWITNISGVLNRSRNTARGLTFSFIEKEGISGNT